MNCLFLFLRHPDKNKDEEAETKFVEINKAYEVTLASITISIISIVILDSLLQILSDPSKRKLFDLKGVVDDSLNRNNQQQSGEMFDDMGSFFTHSRDFKMHFKMPEMSFYYQQGITLRFLFLLSWRRFILIICLHKTLFILI